MCGLSTAIFFWNGRKRFYEKGWLFLRLKQRIASVLNMLLFYSILMIKGKFQPHTFIEGIHLSDFSVSVLVYLSKVEELYLVDR